MIYPSYNSDPTDFDDDSSLWDKDECIGDVDRSEVEDRLIDEGDRRPLTGSLNWQSND